MCSIKHVPSLVFSSSTEGNKNDILLVRGRSHFGRTITMPSSNKPASLASWPTALNEQIPQIIPATACLRVFVGDDENKTVHLHLEKRKKRRGGEEELSLLMESRLSRYSNSIMTDCFFNHPMCTGMKIKIMYSSRQPGKGSTFSCRIDIMPE